MLYSVLSRGGLKVSRLGLGTVQFGLDYGFTKAKSQAEVDRILDLCAERGLSLLDTASTYGDSEKKIGDYLRRRPDSRFVICTKAARLPDQEPIFEHLQRSLQASLAALRVDTVGVLQLHHCSPRTVANPGFWDALARLREDRRFASFGVSVYETGEAEDLIANHSPEVDVLQVPFSVLDQRFRGLFYRSAQAGISMLGRSAFLKGMITAPDDAVPAWLSPLLPHKRRLTALAAEAGLSSGEAALLFAVAEEGLRSVLVGVDSADELGKNLTTLAKMDSAARIMDRLRSLGVEDRALVDPRQWAERGF